MAAPEVTGSKSMYADVKHTTTGDVDVLDSNDVKYSAIAGTRSVPVSLKIGKELLAHAKLINPAKKRNKNIEDITGQNTKKAVNYDIIM